MCPPPLLLCGDNDAVGETQELDSDDDDEESEDDSYLDNIFPCDSVVERNLSTICEFDDHFEELD